MATVKSKTLWVGDKWQLGVQYRNADGSNFVFTSDQHPYVEFYLGKPTNPVITCSVMNGKLTIVDPTTHPGLVVVSLTSDDIPADVLAPKGTFNRLHASLVDLNDEGVTQQVLPLDIRDPRTGDVSSAKFDTVTVVVQGSLAGGGIEQQVFHFGAQLVWTIVHNLNRVPDIVCVDTAGDMIIGDPDYVNGNIATVTFTAPVAGTAYVD